MQGGSAVDEEKKGKSFVVKDKRIFSEDSEAQTAETLEEKTAPEEKPLDKRAGREAEETGPAQEVHYPEINFVNFVISLGTSAMYHFGDYPDPETGKSEVNLTAAKQTIDILGMLESKTKGNLDENEKNLIDGLLFELRMRYVKEKEKTER
jgi:hypothetical protein